MLIAQHVNFYNFVDVYNCIVKLNSTENLIVSNSTKIDKVLGPNSELLEFFESQNNVLSIDEIILDSIEIDSFCKISNWDNVGKYFLKRALQNIQVGNYSKAFEYITLGYEYVICDCGIGDWDKEFLDSDFGFDSAYKIHKQNSNDALVIGFAYWVKNDNTTAINYIDKYIAYYPEKELGYYLKGRISEDIEFLEKACSICSMPRTLHRISRINDSLEKVFIANFLGYLSLCSISDFTRHTKLNKIKLINPFSTYLGVQFNKLGESDSKLKHWFDFRFHLDKLSKMNIITFNSGSIKSYGEIIEDFRVVLWFNSRSFTKKYINTLNIDNIEFIEEDEEDDDFDDDDDFSEDYRRSYNDAYEIDSNEFDGWYDPID